LGFFGASIRVTVLATIFAPLGVAVATTITLWPEAGWSSFRTAADAAFH